MMMMKRLAVLLLEFWMCSKIFVTDQNSCRVVMVFLDLLCIIFGHQSCIWTRGGSFRAGYNVGSETILCMSSEIVWQAMQREILLSCAFHRIVTQNLLTGCKHRIQWEQLRIFQLSHNFASPTTPVVPAQRCYIKNELSHFFSKEKCVWNVWRLCRTSTLTENCSPS